jgi:N-methylhydantoinase B
MDGVELAVLRSRLEGIVSSMVNTVTRTGRSGVLNTARDCSCCLITSEAEFLLMAEAQPIHVLGGPDVMAQTMKEFHPELRRGDAFLHNSPYHGNSHAADHSILVPVVDDEGIHRFTMFTKAHQADDGASQPTTYYAAARDVYEEGALIFPCVKVQEDYVDRDDIIRMCQMRIRAPEQWWGDYLALLGGARVGETLMLELGREVGWERLEEFVESWFDYSERKMVSAIGEIPSGRATVSGQHDPFPGVPDGVPLNVTVEVDSETSYIDLDLRDNPDCLPNGLNLTEATARTAAYIGVYNSIDHTVPVTAGSARRLRIHLREGCCVGVPEHPACCAAATSNIVERIPSLIQRAIAELSESKAGMAEAGPIFTPGAGVISGSSDGRPFVNQIFFGLTGGPASPDADGWLNYLANGVCGVGFRDSVELDEVRFPILVEQQRVVTDSEGAGRFRGAPAAYVEYGPVSGELEVMFVSDGAVTPGQGSGGGLAGSTAKQFRRDARGELEALDPCGQVVLEPGETIVSVCCSGGGYGPPTDRDPELVQADVLENVISRERAERVYGVVVDSQGSLDLEATARTRHSLRDTQPAGTAAAPEEAGQ